MDKMCKALVPPFAEGEATPSQLAPLLTQYSIYWLCDHRPHIDWASVEIGAFNGIRYCGKHQHIIAMHWFSTLPL